MSRAPRRFPLPRAATSAAPAPGVRPRRSCGRSPIAASRIARQGGQAAAGFAPTEARCLAEDSAVDPDGFAHAPAPTGPGLGAAIDFDLIERKKIGDLS
jgi:hypothetical protein